MSPVPGLEGVASPLKEVAFHHYTIRSVHIELHLGLIVGEILRDINETKINVGFCNIFDCICPCAKSVLLRYVKCKS